MGLFNFRKKTEIKYFPKKASILVNRFNEFDNFFPIAIVNLKKFGLDRNVPLVYIFFDHSKDGFSNGDDIDHFAFNLNKDNKLQPQFEESSLKISNGYEKYLKKSITKYNSYKDKGHKSWLIDFSDSPEWWQWDETPKNKKGVKMTFICQIDTCDFSEDDCRMYIFLDSENLEIRTVYQRT